MEEIMKAHGSIALYFLTVSLFCLVFLLAGCAVEKNPPFGAAEIVTDPAGADVINVQDSSTLGTTPLNYVRETKDGEAEYMIVKITKPGYEDKTVSFFISPKYGDGEAAANDPQHIEVNLMPMN